MKALMGNRIKELRQDLKARQKLRDFIAHGDGDEIQIKLDNGKVYIVSRRNLGKY
jgi:cell division septal protein FtsQ